MLRSLYRYWSDFAPVHVQADRIARMLGYQGKVVGPGADDAPAQSSDEYIQQLLGMMPAQKIDLAPGDDPMAAAQRLFFGMEVH